MPGTPDRPNGRPRRGSVFSWLGRWRSRRAAARLPTLTLRATPDGFEVLADGKPDWSLRWDEVDGVVAFKYDVMVYDIICFAFARRGDPDRLWCIDEDTDGFDAVRPSIEHVTNGAWPAAFERVAKPAFEYNWTVLRADEGSAAAADEPSLIWRGIDAASGETV